jgi:hypothetical protein
MRYLLPLLFIFGCESWGVFKHEHEHEGGACVKHRSYNVPDSFTCYENWTESYCIKEHTGYVLDPTYQWTDLTCEEFCDDVDATGSLHGYYASCEINTDDHK